MSVTRIFLDWNTPALPAAADFLIRQYTVSGGADLSGVIAVVPGRRAGRRLLELLIDTADRAQVRLTPPIIDTVGRLPERLYEPRKQFAKDLVNKFAWTAALRELDEEQIHSIIPDPPADHDISRWLSFGELLWKQHRELAAEGLDFQDVVTRGPDVDAFDETERWELLRRVQLSCLQKLDQLDLWDLQSARLFAIEHQECQTENQIVLIGTSDLNSATRQMLDQVADHVTTLIHAPERMSQRFDQYGCIVPDQWSGVTIDLRSDQIEVADGPVDQAQAVVRTLAGYQGRYRIDEVTIGITDDRLVPEIDRHLTEQSVASRWVVGQELRESRPYKLLQAVADFLETERFEPFAALIRQVDVDRWLAAVPADLPDGLSSLDENSAGSSASAVAPASWLVQLDEYFNRHVPAAPGDWIGPEEERDQITHAWNCLTNLLAPLTVQSAPLGDWGTPLTDLLMTVYGEFEFDLEDPAQAYTLAACRQIHELLLLHSDIPSSLAPEVSAPQAIRLLLKELGSESVPPWPNDEAVELLGWLELPLDDAPAVVVTTFNEGFVPSSLNSDAFLPNELRRHLGLLDNRRRYARDAYALSVLAASRRALKLIVGRRDMRGDPLRPSRLLFATEAVQIAERVLACFGSPEDPSGTVREQQQAQEPVDGLASDRNCATGTAFVVPRPQPLKRPIERISVTSFRTYLACPYRFYLRHVLRLKHTDDTASELDALMFGNLMHDVLNQFGNSDVRSSRSASDIRRELRSLLETCVQETLGESRLPAVNVQMMQLQWRLDAFADWQAEWAQQGWHIVHSEVSFRNRGVKLELPGGGRIQLDGRIDRIDRLGDSETYVIFDYKTGENVRTPRQSHQKGDEWVDLQLPLYRHLASHIGLSGDVRLGYIVLPKDTKKVQHLMADWNGEELADADATALDVATRIVNQEFWPPADVDPSYFSEFAAICQDGVFDREEVL